MRPLNVIAYIHAYVGTGRNAGAELTMHEMLFALRQAGHKITVLLSEPIEPNLPFAIDGIKVQPYASRKDPNLWMPQFDISVSHLGCAERAALISKDKGIKNVQVVHNTHQLTYDSLRAHCDLAVFNTDWVSDDCKVPVRNRMVLRPPVRPASYVIERGKQAVTLINMTEPKGARVFYELARRFPDVPFIGVKGGYGEQMLPGTASWAEALPNITILPNHHDVREVYAQTKVILMPSGYESFGRVAVEAAASGIPSIVSRTPGLMEALGDAGTYADSPMTMKTGEIPDDPWTLAMFDDWEAKLKVLLTGRGYGAASKAAKERSEFLWTQTERELEEFVIRTENLAYGYRKPVRGGEGDWEVLRTIR